MIELGLGARREPDEEFLQFARQLGVPNIILHTPPVRGEGYWDFQHLVQFRRRVEAAGLKLAAIENVPENFMDKIKRGVPGRDEQIENMQKTIRNIGRAGIPVLGYHFILLGVWRTDHTPTGRGGARVTKYNHAFVENAPITEIGEYDDETLWANLEYFLKAVVPVAEENGVKLALHPDDPPVPVIAGTARIIRSIEAYKRVMDIVPSPSNCIEFCQGTVSEMAITPEEVYEAIRYFGSRDKISYVHFRNVRGMVPEFEETFIDEGRIDMLKALQAYKDSGCNTILIVDHTPGMVDDTGWGHRGRAFAIGYMKGMMKSMFG